ncbi:hypothetical protein PIIN_07740 [Serendipita indica DSM 11827]|uniref:COX assembly mitochondrial protein n=1 Tax=Serendipita indica (strain DSM 11827) TaxID=1109443 RepID=G4TR43_SERID|nr:hypothetical protein PIIN_07740 [Serendipita indica DSM 11827]
MHAHLVDQKELACKEFVEALRACHADWAKKFTGGCNDAKNELNSCLRRERVERTNKHLEESKARKQAIDEKMRKWREEE